MNKTLKIILLITILYGCVPVVGVSTVGAIKTGVQISSDPRTFGTMVDDSIIEKSFKIKITQLENKYFLTVKGKSLDGRFFIKGEINSIDEKILMTKLAWETNGVRSVQNNLAVKDETTWRDKAQDILITSQLKVALVGNKNVKSGNFHVIRETNMPAILIEGGFLTNPQERNCLKDKKYIEKMAQSIANGIDKYLKS